MYLALISQDGTKGIFPPNPSGATGKGFIWGQLREFCCVQLLYKCFLGIPLCTIYGVSWSNELEAISTLATGCVPEQTQLLGYSTSKDSIGMWSPSSPCGF